MNLPLITTKNQDLSLLQSKWKSILDPIAASPSANVSILKNVSLNTGLNTINHLLGRKLQGWRLVRLRASSTIFDQQDSNTMPELTLVLNASAPVVVDLEVF